MTTNDHQESTSAVPYNPFDDYQESTSAVPFDPFAEDDEDDFPLLGKLPLPQQDPSAASRHEALTTFRQRRATTRGDRAVANGMVHLPFIPIKETEFLNMEGVPPQEQPPLQPGDLLAEQYEILGTIAKGGLGWIYLAEDRNISGRVVVVKGLMAKDNPRDYAAAVSEREFLADITHPVIVKAYNFIDDPRVEGGLIVMEYAPGPSLRERSKAQPGGIFPIDIAIGYILEVLPALEYLHARGVVYNDLKPDNIIVTEDQVKLIDLGAVSGIKAFGYIFGTKGFQAPEVATEGPSIASDIYTIGRTLAALTIQLPHKNGVYLPELPDPSTEPTFAHYLSFYRLLKRATDPDPKKRFSSIREIETQLYGVLREYLAIHEGRQYPAQHSLFSPQRSTFGTKHVVFRTDQIVDGIKRDASITPAEVVAALHIPLLDRSDPGASMIAGSSYTEPSETLQTLRDAYKLDEFVHSKELPLGIVRSLLDLGFTRESANWLRNIQPTLGDDWRFQWYEGITYLLLENYEQAQSSFNEVFTILPGESAPKLARAAISELLLQKQGLANTSVLSPEVVLEAATLKGDIVNDMAGVWNKLTQDPVALRYKAIYLYALVWATNPTTVSSAFGLARQLMAEHQLELAIEALDKVPAASMHHRMARLTTILYLISGTPTEENIRRAARRLEEIPTNEPRFLQLEIAILNKALEWLRSNDLQASANNQEIFEYEFTQKGLRTGLAKKLRLQARSSPTARHRYTLVDTANKVRPKTWF
ncbi:serine/threonine protein kinase [Corynebacterium sp. HS2168-gen11]|uniref:serine/threonine protein kinase n=1 Tax=Corynebacterium sp. HS2168-gen11 TaxID=2974027 RepID=UPI00216B1412|nr:serine/threonine protein kinase [Corynebacterium sp. HS2168-gen11]MCS4536145.1 protein kinase [Corynebacterium sp. HS2168-gen11]